MTEASIPSQSTIPKTSSLRLLILTPSANPQTALSPIPPFLTQLTRTAPSPDVGVFAGYTSHPPLHLKTKYYDSNVSIWCDELPSTGTLAQPSGGTSIGRQSNTSDIKDNIPSASEESKPSLSDWSEQMLSTTAKEVRDVIGGIIVLLPFTYTSISSSTLKASQLSNWLSYVETANSLRDAVEDESGRDVASIVVLHDMTPGMANVTDTKSIETLAETLEEECLNKHGVMGWDYVLWKSSTNIDKSTISEATGDTTGQENAPVSNRNEFGEEIGFPRIIEVLTGTDWTVNPASLDEDLDIDADDDSYLPDINVIKTNDNDYKDINRNTRANLRASPGGTETESLLSSEHDSFQREMLGLKMAMLDVNDGREASSPSSLAGEVDTSDLGQRTPLPVSSNTNPTSYINAGAGASASGSPRVSRPSKLSRGISAYGDDDDGEEMQVDQLSGLMERIVAMREAAGELSGPEKEAFAKREVNRIMKELG